MHIIDQEFINNRPVTAGSPSGMTKMGKIALFFVFGL
jgi:hypothetical protein